MRVDFSGHEPLQPTRSVAKVDKPRDFMLEWPHDPLVLRLFFHLPAPSGGGERL